MSFVTLHTGLSGLRASQTAVDTTSNNIANVNTPGYTRQRVEFSPRTPYDSPVGQVGTGVEVDRVVRLRDSFLDARVRTTTATFAASDTRATLLSRLEQVLSEPDQGISVELDELWAAFEDLALDPSSLAVRTTALGQLDAVAGRVREVASGIEQLRTETEAASGELLTEAQDLLESVAEINARVANAPEDRPDNDLQDQRDVLLDRLAGLLGATSRVGSDGSATVVLSGQTLVDGRTVSVLGIDAGSQLTVDDPTLGSGPVPVAPADTTGELGGVLQVLGDEVPQLVADLDAFVTRFTTDLNDQHGLGFTDADAAGAALLAFTAGDAAATLRLATTDPAALALRGSAGSGSHDNVNALELADLRSEPLDGGVPYGEELRQVVVGFASRLAAAGRSAEAAAEVTTAAQVARQSQHGVSLDEEMVSLVQFQRALEANSRIMTAADQILNTIINGMGIVGR